MIYLGTCGYSFSDWVGTAYPRRSRAAERLRYYASSGFNAVELPAWQEGKGPLGAEVPKGFAFTAVLPEPALAGADALARLRRELEPLQADGRLKSVLAELPLDFAPGPESRSRIEALQAELKGVLLAVELRAAAWRSEETAAWLTQRGIALCAADAPAHPSLLGFWNRTTSPLAYFRLHGRNPQGGERGDYAYSDAELRQLAGEIKAAQRRALQTFVFFGNTLRGQAYKDALRLAPLLGLPVKPGPSPLSEPDLFA